MQFFFYDFIIYWRLKFILTVANWSTVTGRSSTGGRQHTKATIFQFFTIINTRCHCCTPNKILIEIRDCKLCDSFFIIILWHFFPLLQFYLFICSLELFLATRIPHQFHAVRKKELFSFSSPTTVAPDGKFNRLITEGLYKMPDGI